MAAAMYRIGPSDTFSPGDLEADAETVDAGVEALDAQIEGNTAVDPTFVDQWVAWQGQWKAFFAHNFGGFFASLFSSLNDSNRDDLIRYETQLASFTSKAAAYGATIVAPIVPSTGAGDTLGKQLKNQLDGAPSLLPSLTSIVVVAVAIIVVLIIWKS